MNFTHIFYNGWKYALVNCLTLSRILICPVILYLLFTSDFLLLASYLLLAAFCTDFLDGFLARVFKVTSELGTKLDSIADDCLFITALVSVIYIYPTIILENIIPITVIAIVYMLKMFFLWYRHKKLISGLHTSMAKLSAFMQAVFFLSALFFEPSAILFKIVYFITIITIIEELSIILTSSDLRNNTKGIFFRSNINKQEL